MLGLCIFILIAEALFFLVEIKGLKTLECRAYNRGFNDAKTIYKEVEWEEVE